MKNKLIIGSGIIVVALAVFSYFFFCHVNSRERQLIDEGNKIIAKIESYKESNNRLPNSLSEIGIEEQESGPLYYLKKDSNNYIVWFGTSVGESKTYYSDSKKWENQAR